MKYLKWTGISLGILLLLLIVLGIVMPKEYTINKSISTEYPASVPYNIINDVSIQPQWNPWMKEFEDMEVTFSDQTVGKGASYAFSSDKIGKGSQLITNSIINKSIDFQMGMNEKEPAEIHFGFAPEEEGSKVTWNMTGRNGFPSNILNFLLKWKIGNMMEEGLDNIADLAEARYDDGAYYGHTIKKVNLPQRSFVIKRAVVPDSDIQQFYVSNLGKLFIAVQHSGESVDGSPCGLFFETNASKGTTDLAAAIPVMEAIAIEGAASLTMDEGPGLVIDHFGDYSGLQEAHLAMETYMADRGMVYHSPRIEEYISDPGEEDDPGKVLTKIYYYLAETGMNNGK